MVHGSDDRSAIRRSGIRGFFSMKLREGMNRTVWRVCIVEKDIRADS